jgi:DNA-binding CsgD family transcriptional regulator
VPDLQLPLTPVTPTVDREASLPLPALSLPLVGAASPPNTPPYLGHSNETHLLQTVGQFNHAKKERKRRALLRAPKDSKVRKTVFAAVALKAQGLKNKDVAEQLGITTNTLKVYMYRAHKNGWFNIDSFEDPDDKLEIVLKSKTIRNLDMYLDNADKEVTLETAKGLGIFKQHQMIKNDTVAPIGIALSVSVEMPPAAVGGAIPEARVGSIGGAPYFDAEVVESE